MPGGRRGPSRQQLSRSALPSLQTIVGGSCGNGTGMRNRNGSTIGLSAPPITALITPEPVRHCRIPDLPTDGCLVFELLFFIYLLMALLVQYINIYKTVWWFPYNHPAATTSLNFHLIDYHLAAFITIMLARRLVWTLISEASQTSTTSVVRYTLLIVARLVLLTLCGWVLCWTLVNLFRNHSVLNLLFLGYPFGVYVPLCCFHQEIRTQPLPADCGFLLNDQLETVMVRPKDFFTLLRESFREQFNNPTSIPVHTCPLSPDLIRNEVECPSSCIFLNAVDLLISHALLKPQSFIQAFLAMQVTLHLKSCIYVPFILDPATNNLRDLYWYICSSYISSLHLHFGLFKAAEVNLRVTVELRHPEQNTVFLRNKVLNKELRATLNKPFYQFGNNRVEKKE